MISRESELTVPESVWSGYFNSAIRSVLLFYIAVLPYKQLLVFERNGFLVLLGLLVLWCLINRKLFYVRTPFDGMLLAFVLWVGFTIPFAAFPEYSLKEYGKLLQWMVVFYAVLYFLADVPYRKWLLYVVGLSIPVVVVYGLTQFSAANPQAVVSFFSAEVWLTTFLVMTIPYCLAAALGETPPALKVIAVVVSSLAVACLLITQSRAGLVALVTELCALAWLARSLRAKIATGIVTVGLLAMVFSAFSVKTSATVSGGSHLESSLPVKTGVATIVHRLDIWQFALSELPKHWLVGIGYGGQSFLRLYGQEGEIVPPGHTGVKDQGTHNLLLYLALHVGLPALAIFLWFYYSAIRITVRETVAAGDWVSKIVLTGGGVSLVGLFVRLQFDQMLVGSLAILFWVLLAMTVIYYPRFQSPPVHRP